MTEEILDVRARIVAAAANLLATGGRDAVSTRAVSAAAGVQAPTIYRQFGDMQGLLDTVAAEVLAEHIREKRVLESSDDPLIDLRAGWDHHVAFGVGNPAAYDLIYSNAKALAESPAKREGESLLRALITRVAEAGRLAVSVPHAVRLIYSGCRGVTLLLMATPPSERDPRLSHAMREAVINAITIPTSSTAVPAELPGPNRVAARAVALRAVLADIPNALSPAEEQLLGEWLDKLSANR